MPYAAIAVFVGAALVGAGLYTLGAIIAVIVRGKQQSWMRDDERRDDEG